MIDTGLQGWDKALSELTGYDALDGRNGQHQVDIAKQIEQALAPFFGGSDDSFMDSLIASCEAAESSADALASGATDGTSGDPFLDSLIASLEQSDAFLADASSDAGGSSGGISGASTASAAPYSGGSGGGKPVASYFMTHLQKDFGLTQNQAAGIVANLWYESGGMNPNMNQGGHAGAPTSDMEQGYGVAQWTGARKQEFLDFASRNHMDPSSVEANYAFLKHELQTTQAGSINAVKGTTSARDATTAFCNEFERPGVPALDSRYAALAQVLPSSSSVLV